MKILFTSDLHGHEGAYKSFASLLHRAEFSLGVIAGDLMTHLSLKEAEISRKTVMETLQEKIKSFQNILMSSGKPIFFIMGNDDGIIEGGLSWPENKSLININQKRAVYKKFKFIGYQYTVPFVGGLYEKPESEQKKDLARLERKIDSDTILITHGPPRGILDDQNYGSNALRNLVDKNPPRLHLFGHIHQSFGRQGPFINGSFPSGRKFVSIDLDTLESSYLEVLNPENQISYPK